MDRVALWANRHDSAKLILFTLVLVPVMVLAGAAGETILFWFAVLAALALCGVVAYWLGNRKWLFIPLLAMLVFIASAVPAVMLNPTSGETPFSIVIESPFWAGFPALVGAGVGYAIYILIHPANQRRV